MENSQWSWFRAILFIVGFLTLAGIFGHDDMQDAIRVHNAERGLSK